MAARAVPAMLLAWCLVALGIAWHGGLYDTAALVLLLAGSLLLAGAVLAGAVLAGAAPPRAVRLAAGDTGRRSGPSGLPAILSTAAAALLTAAAPVVFRVRLPPSSGRLVGSEVLEAVAGLLTAGLLVAAARGRAGGRWAALAAAAAAAGLAADLLRVLAVTHPHIDVDVFLQQATEGLAHLRNPYGRCWTGSPGLQCGFPYTPLAAVLLVPGRLLGDVRYAELAALAVAVAAGSRLCADRSRLPLVLLVVVFPDAPYSLAQAWTEPLVIALLLLFALAVARGHLGWAVVALAAACATKQYALLAVPVAALWPDFGWRRATASLPVAAVICLPFAAAGPRAFWHDVVTLNLDYPHLSDALDLAAFTQRHGWIPGVWLTVAVVAGAYWVCWRHLAGGVAGMLIGTALVELALDLTNKQSFFNHYTLPMSLLAVGLAALPAGRQDRDGSPPAAWAPAKAPAGAPPVQ